MTPFSAFRRSLLFAAMIGVAGTALAQTPPASPPAAPAASPPAAAPAAPPPPKAVYFINLKDGQTVTSPFKVQFGLSGMGVAPAGVDKPNTGHHHLLIDTKLSADQLKEAIPMDSQHLHFGGGQTETMVTLPPGKHTLQLELANWSHIPFAPPVESSVITINVQGPEAAKSSTKSSTGPAKARHAHHARHRAHHHHSGQYMQQ